MKSTNLRLLLQRGGSRRLFITSIVAAVFWSALVVSCAIVLAHVIVAIIHREENSFHLILILAALWGIRSLFQSSFERWCSHQAIEIKREIRGEVTSHLEQYAHISPSIISTLLIKGLNSLDIYLGRFLPQLFFALVTPFVVIATLFFLDQIGRAHV